MIDVVRAVIILCYLRLCCGCWTRFIWLYPCLSCKKSFNILNITACNVSIFIWKGLLTECRHVSSADLWKTVSIQCIFNKAIPDVSDVKTLRRPFRHYWPPVQRSYKTVDFPVQKDSNIKLWWFCCASKNKLVNSRLNSERRLLSLEHFSLRAKLFCWNIVMKIVCTWYLFSPWRWLNYLKFFHMNNKDQFTLHDYCSDMTAGDMTTQHPRDQGPVSI